MSTAYLPPPPPDRSVRDYDIYLINRDPHDMNNFLQVEFEDVFAEPLSTQSIDCVWRNSIKCFTCGKNICYKILTTLCGIFVALYWGCTFAQLSFTQIWCCVPQIRAMRISLYPIRKILLIILGTFVGPCVETCSLIFARIHVSTTNNALPPKPLDFTEESNYQHRRVIPSNSRNPNMN